MGNHPQPIIKYVYSCTNAFFNYLKNENLEELIQELRRVEKHAYQETDSETSSLWFKFGKGDTGATDINNIQSGLSLPKNHRNYKYLIEQINGVIGLAPEDELQVYYS